MGGGQGPVTISRRFARCCRHGILVFLLQIVAGPGAAVSLEAESRFPLLVSGGTHSLTVPWHPGPVTVRLNPALVIGTERTLRPSDRLRLYHTANFGFFRNYWWMTAVFVDAELGVSRGLPFGFQGDLRLGLGYLHYFWRRETLELRNGRYVPAANHGKPSVMAPLSILLTYGGSPTRPLTVSPFVSAQWAVQGLFADEIPVMTHFLLLAGVRITRGRPAPAGGR